MCKIGPEFPTQFSKMITIRERDSVSSIAKITYTTDAMTTPSSNSADVSISTDMTSLELLVESFALGRPEVVAFVLAAQYC